MSAVSEGVVEQIVAENERLREALRQVEALCHTETRQKLLAIVQPVLAALSSPPADAEPLRARATQKPGDGR